ncbi:MAG TPA: hypothetical protein VIL49_15010, partial [Capillimicrobium sp.]
MRLLCVDHFFEQDIDALRHDATGSRRCWTVAYERFYDAAAAVFDDDVFVGIEEYFRPEHAAARDRYAAIAREQVAELYAEYRFDALLIPSDTFFWVRALVTACQGLGLPVVCLQKEAVIPPGWLEGPAREWGQISPFIADHMLVSSEHHRTFWLNGGVAADIVEVTGQPRFDIYRRPERRRSWAEVGVDVPAGRPTILFLTYDANAYLPIIDRTGLAPWAQMRAETEAVLLELAAAGEATVLIKGHPQWSEDQSAHLAQLGSNPGVLILDPQGDVRQYVLNADVVLGFQTTALFESLAAGRPTFYTWWSPATQEYAADLIPFHEADEALTVARSPQALRNALRDRLADPSAGPDPTAASALVETYLGRVDGAAGERCWTAIERIVAGRRLTGPGRAALAAAHRSRPR